MDREQAGDRGGGRIDRMLSAFIASSRLIGSDCNPAGYRWIILRAGRTQRGIVKALPTPVSIVSTVPQLETIEDPALFCAATGGGQQLVVNWRTGDLVAFHGLQFELPALG